MEVATFKGDDEPCLVRAALACPVCLSGAVAWSLERDDWEAQAQCACMDCGHRRAVLLDPWQALRLALGQSQRLPA